MPSIPSLSLNSLLRTLSFTLMSHIIWWKPDENRSSWSWANWFSKNHL